MELRHLAVALVVALSGCGTAVEPDRTDAAAKPVLSQGDMATDAHSSRTSVDWSGRYSGTLPCADCEGIRTTVILEKDGRFRRSLVYLGKPEQPAEESGTFIWNDTGSVVTLATDQGSTQSYQVGENVLFHLDQAGDRISGDLADRYRLVKAFADSRIEDRKWLLVELIGQTIDPAEGGQQAFLVLDSEQSRVHGNASCNNFFGGYLLQDGNRIAFGEDMGATMMACLDMSTEQTFLDVLRKVDNYSLGEDMLSLNRARMAPLARFALSGDTQ